MTMLSDAIQAANEHGKAMSKAKPRGNAGFNNLYVRSHRGYPRSSGHIDCGFSNDKGAYISPLKVGGRG